MNDILNSINGLLENLLNWSMMQRDMLEYKPVNVNLYNVVNKIIEISGQGTKEKNISISSIIDTRTFVYADVDMLRTVVQNLIINAIKFTHSGGQINVSSVDKDGFVEVSVQDNGIGIDEEKSAGLFNFSTLFSTNGTAGEKGTGLGLPLCKEFVERNEGKIWVESKPGKGSKFTFTLRKMVS
ncbi:MAG: sensor histidine kinase [Ignavibacteriales bacterium]|nr:MAG: sensor histidine kinase [Ignavibacteriales bacterium]